MRFNIELTPAIFKELPTDVKEQVYRTLAKKLQAESETIAMLENQLHSRKNEAFRWQDIQNEY